MIGSSLLMAQGFRRRRSLLPPVALPAMSLEKVWKEAAVGRMSPMEQVRALALRDASKEIHDGDVNHQWNADRVKVT